MKELLEKIIDVPSPYNSKEGKVIEVDTKTRTCDVEPLDGAATIFDVRLQAFIDNTEGVVVFPKKDSVVTVTMLNNEKGFVSQTSDIDYIQVVKGGFDLKKELDKMFDLTDSLLSLLTKFQLLTNVGTTVQVMPNIVFELQQMKQKNKNIKSQFAKIIK